MLVLHHLERSRSRSFLWLFEELGLDYEIKEYKRNPKTFRAPPELRKIHPLGKAPIVTDGDVVLAESGAIIDYVLATYGEGRLQPESGTEAARQLRYFLYYAEGSLMPPLLLRLIFDKVQEAKMPFLVKPVINGIVKKVNQAFIEGEMTLHTEFLETTLSKHTWLTGDMFTAADIAMNYPVESLVARGRRPESETKHLRAFLERARERPAYQRALERGAGEAF